MNLGDLLTELRQNILHDRSDRVAGNDDRLWSDATLVSYINQAQRRFARKSMCLRDSRTDDCCKITLQTGVDQYTLHDAVLAVLSARVAGDYADLARAGHAQLDTYHQPDSYFFDPSQLANLPAGKPVAFTTDETMAEDSDGGQLSAEVIRFYPTPSADYSGTVVRLRVVRLPLYEFRADQLKMEPEIPEDHHIEMLDWAAYLALRIVDRDIEDGPRAKDFAASFEAHVKGARDEAMRKLFTPQPWGFGRNGFTWER